MTPIHEIRIGELPKEIAETLPDKIKGDIFNNGGAFFLDQSGEEDKLIQFTYEQSQRLRGACRGSDTLTLYVVSPASDPDNLRKKRKAQYGDYDIENAGKVSGRKG